MPLSDSDSVIFDFDLTSQQQETKGAQYEMIISRSQCVARLAEYEPQLCDEFNWDVAVVGM